MRWVTPASRASCAARSAASSPRCGTTPRAFASASTSRSTASATSASTSTSPTRCRRHGQTRPTPLLLRYRAGGYNRLHQDVYGALAFPLQVAVLLSLPGRDFTGGEFLLLEQRAREQARVEVIALSRGEAVVFPNRERPDRVPRGDRRVQVRHGVARVLSGHRATLGLIFHDAK